jgi:hypothetical protein
MAVVHLLPVPRSNIGLLVQISAMLLLIANAVLVRKITRAIPGGSSGEAVSASGLTAFYLPLNKLG